VLLKAGIVEKVPSLTEHGQLSIRYKIRDNAAALLAKVQDVCNRF
jgi:hypothetical protein